MTSANVQSFTVKLSDTARGIIDRIEFAETLLPVLDRDYLVKGWLDRGALSVLYGDANVGKSFFAIDMAHHVQQGIDWAGRRVKQGQVLYIAAEGGSGLNNRLVARGAKFMVLRGQMVLAGRNNTAPALAEAVECMERHYGPFALIVVDTMARVMGGANENEAPAIAALITSLDLIRDRTGAHVMLIHHSGKNAEQGARGHSSLRAAIDTEIRLSKPDDGSPYSLARTTKQRDMIGGAEIEFDLRTVTLGQDSDGDPVTSCVVQHHINQRGNG